MGVTGGLICDQIQYQGRFQQRLWAIPVCGLQIKMREKNVDFSLDCLGTFSWHSDSNVAKVVLSKLCAAVRVLLSGRGRGTYGQADNRIVRQTVYIREKAKMVEGNVQYENSFF